MCSLCFGSAEAEGKRYSKGKEAQNRIKRAKNINRPSRGEVWPAIVRV